MSFTDGKPHIVTERDLTLSWMGGKNGIYFRCHFCGVKFKVGDTYRFIFSNHVKGAGGNPLTCAACDTENNETMIDKWKAIHVAMKEAKDKYWWFFRGEDD